MTLPRLSAPLAALILALMVLATQFVGLGREVIDPDESTFILMGADVAKGHLPFVEQFDLKPPMIFVLIGSVLAAFGKSLVAVRLLGDVLLFGTAMVTFRFARHLVSPWAALGGAMLYVGFASMDLGQPTYSELPALFFGMGALLCLARTPVSLPRAALCGALMALAVLSRTNLYQLPVMFGLVLLIAAWRKSDTVHPRAWLAYGLGGLAPVALLVIAYAEAGQLDVLKMAMIDVPLSYSQQVGPLAAAIENAGQFYVTTTIAPLIVIPLVLLALAGLLRLAMDFRSGSRPHWQPLILVLALLTVAVSLVFSGAVYPHYWLQIAPLLGVACAVGIESLRRFRGGAALAALLVGMSSGSALAARVPEGLAVVTDPSATERRFEVAQAARFIQTNAPPHATVWPWRKQLIVWYLDTPQLSRAGVQPENIARPPIVDPLADAGYVSHDEVGRLLGLRPTFIVTDTAGKGLEWMRATGRPVEQWLAQNYTLDARFGDVLIYRRIN